MQINSSIRLDQSLISQNESQRLITLKQLLKRKRNRMLITHVILFMIIVATILSTSILKSQSTKNNQTINELNSNTSLISDWLNYRINNQVISFSKGDKLKHIKIVSSSDNKRITKIDISESNIVQFTNNKFPLLITLKLPQSIVQFNNNTIGINQFNTTFPRLKNIINNTFVNVEELQFDNSHLSTLSYNYFPRLKRLVFNNSSLEMLIQNTFPMLEYFQISDCKQITSVEVQGKDIKQIKFKNVKISSLSIFNTQVTKIQNICNTQLLQIVNCPITQIACFQFTNITTLTLLNTSIQHFKIKTNTLKHLIIANISSLQSFDLITSNQIKPTVLISNTSIKRIQNLNNYIYQIELNLNYKLQVFENNTLHNLKILFISSPIITFKNNILPLLVDFFLVQYKTNTLSVFDNNDISFLKNLSIVNQSLTSFKGNTLTSVKYMNFSNNKINDKLAQQIILQNQWSKQLVLKVDLTLNNFNDKQNIKSMYEKAFFNAIVNI